MALESHRIPVVELRGKIAAITGASSGIGRATAVALARKGCSVVLAARRREELETTAATCREFGVRAQAVVTDVSNADSCSGFIEQAITNFGTVDLLVNNAGFAIFDSIVSARGEDMQTMMQTNFFGAVYCTQAVLPHMLEKGSGAIVNVASIVGLMGYSRMGLYASTKFAMVGFSESLRVEVASRGVKVSLVCPGTTETEFFQIAERGKMPGAARLVLGIKPETVAEAIVRAAETGSYRTIVPFAAHLYIRFKEIFPRSAHFLMRKVSSLIDKKG